MTTTAMPTHQELILTEDADYVPLEDVSDEDDAFIPLDGEPVDKEEYATLKNFVDTHPFPTYAEMEHKLLRQIDLYAEYGENNHTQCKRMYEAYFADKQLNIAAGQSIGTGGGTQAKTMNYYTLLQHAPTASSTNDAVRAACIVLQAHWNGVCGWKF